MIEQETDDAELLMCNELWMECPDRSLAWREEEKFGLSEHVNEPILYNSLQHWQNVDNHAALSIIFTANDSWFLFILMKIDHDTCTETKLHFNSDE